MLGRTRYAKLLNKMKRLLTVYLAAVAVGICAQSIPVSQQKKLVLNSHTLQVKALKNKSRAVTQKLGDLAQSGNMPTNDEALELMRGMLDELQEINDRMERIEAELASLKAKNDQLEQKVATTSKATEANSRFKPSAYAQFQYIDSSRNPNQGGVGSSPNNRHAFDLRRLQIGGTYSVDPRVSLKFSFDGSTNNGSTRGNGFELRDAVLTYIADPNKARLTQVVAGQFQVMMGYESDRSAALREFPEHTTFHRKMFEGERIRGAYISRKLNPEVTGILGVGGSMAVRDPEQVSRDYMPSGSAAGFGSLRYEKQGLSAGITHFQGDRPATGFSTTGTQVNHPAIHRQFTSADLSYSGLLDSKLTLRAEAIMGQDRIPASGPAATPDSIREANPVSAYHVFGAYTLSSSGQIIARYGIFDPSTRSGAINAIQEFGLGYRYSFAPGSTLTLTREWFHDNGIVGASRNYQVTTLRYQIRF